jgi:predicted RNase H-like nuclease
MKNGLEVVGVDGAKAGWVAVALVDGRFTRAVEVANLVELPREFPAASVFAIDVPMHLNADTFRSVDAKLRRQPGVSPSTVFNAPPRRALDAASHEAAQRWCTSRGLMGFSQQSWALREKIISAEVLHVEAKGPSFVEVHPEATFALMNKGARLRGGKRSWNGVMHRRQLLAELGITLPDELPNGVGGIGIDDVLDAAAAAWSALRYGRGGEEFVKLSVEGERAFVVI